MMTLQMLWKAFNRTVKELKFPKVTEISNTKRAFNRTVKELKFNLSADNTEIEDNF